ncbi:GGDEF domain-containing protein [Dokdonella immobilis]|uniref:diguanylate cyclase n=1 Tax=Dokdonella immobilis TaxID=578942 RepID=A0A1I4Z6N3_9GAMM|nr:GGDEF domain-containing protein [Dokdonella immobilis]SFN45935.1 diguanylate cyclase (GGDEF) domain-containing protein [Dokdonella immobilis]
MPTTEEFWPGLAAVMLNGLALLLALGFRRNRAVMVLVVMTCAALALAGVAAGAGGERGLDAMRMFAPWLLLAIAAMPERRLLARRNLAVIGLLATATWLTLAAPAHVWPELRDAFPFGWLPMDRGLVAAGIVLLAAAVCLARWVVRRTVMEFAMGLVLIVVGIAQLPVMRADGASSLFCLAAMVALVAILHASYRMAFVDGLAGLPNRRALDETLARLSGDYAVAMVDVDHFKTFNDRHGHAAGDRALKAVAEQLRATRGATAFRYGGEEFCLLFTGARSRSARQACEELRKRIAAMRIRVRAAPRGNGRKAGARPGAGEVKVTVSIGLAERDTRARGSDEALKAADKALYKAKGAGRNCVRLG